MKSKKAQEFIKSETYHHVGFEPLTADILHVSDAEEAVELAEAEMREHAIEAAIETCEFRADWCCGAREFGGAILDSPDICKGKDCLYIKKFIKMLDNPKTEQI